MVPASPSVYGLASLNRGSPTTLTAQLVDRLRRAVLEGALPPDHALPSSRELARGLGVSRNTVIAAYEALAAEGTIVVRPRRVPVVAHVPVREGKGGLWREAPPGDAEPERRAGPRRADTASPRAERSAPAGRVSKVVARLSTVIPGEKLDQLLSTRTRWRPFGVGLPALENVPWRILERCLVRRFRSMPTSDALHDDPRGSLALRRAVLHHVTIARGVRATVDQVFITEGSQGAIDLCCRSLLDPGDAAWLEASCPLALRAAVRMAGARVVPIPVDEDGLRVQVGVRRAPDARVAFVSPACAFPSGARLSLPRRIELLSWADQSGAWLIEIDYEGELRFDRSPLPSLRALDIVDMGSADDRIIHIGTFSRSLFPGLRLGFMIVPVALVRAVAQVRAASTRSPPYVLQAAVADFIEEGHFARHLRRLKQETRRRRELLLRELGRLLPSQVKIKTPSGGAVLTLELPSGADDVALVQALSARGVDALALSRLSPANRASRGLILGFGAHAEPSLRDAARTLADVVGAALRPMNERSRRRR